MSFPKKIIIYFLIYINIIEIIRTIKYPLNKDIDKTEKSNITSKMIESKDQYLNYILNYDYVISLIYFSPFEQFSKTIKIFDTASSYKIINKWIFLKVQCEEPNDICQLYENNYQSIPLIKIFIKSIEQKEINLSSNFELSQLLEFLLKYLKNPIIDINDDKNIKEYYNNYGTFSPLVIYDKEHTEFISCISMLAKKKYMNYFYFGAIPIKNDKKEEKIIFDKDNYPISMSWEGECDDIDTFLLQNIYQLINKVDESFIYQLNIIPRILVILIANISKNKKIKDFINNYYKKISYVNRELVFGFIDYNEDKNFTNKYKIYIKNDNDIKLMIYNFYENIYYIHPIIYNIDSQNEKKIYNEINNLCNNLSSLWFTTGSIFKDLIRKLGLDKLININDKKQLTALGFTIFIIILGFFYLFIFDNYNSKSNSQNKNKTKKE